MLGSLGIRQRPEVTIESASGIRTVDLQTMLFEEGKIMIDGDITDEVAYDFTMQMMYLQKMSKDAEVIISSLGGVPDACLLMYDMIQGYKKEIKMTVIGQVGTLTGLLVASVKKGNRYILPHAKIIMNDNRPKGAPGFTAAAMSNGLKSFTDTNQKINELLARHTDRTIEEINSAKLNSAYFVAEDAIKFGFVDHIEYNI